MIHKHHQFMWSFTKTFFRSIRRPVFVYLLTLSLTVQILFAGVFYSIESGSNPRIQSYFDSLYFTVTIMTGVGLGDIHPVTILGKSLAMLMMIIGTGIFVSFTAVLAAIVLDVEKLHRDDRDMD